MNLAHRSPSEQECGIDRHNSASATFVRGESAGGFEAAEKSCIYASFVGRFSHANRCILHETEASPQASIPRVE